MKRLLSALLLITAILSASPISLTPEKVLEIDGVCEDLQYKDGLLIVGTDSGKMVVYDSKSLEKKLSLQLPKIKDFMGDEIDTKVFSVDYSDGRYLLLSDSGIGGYADLRIYENGKEKKIVSGEDGKAIIKARFVDKDHILLGHLSNEAELIDANSGKSLYRVQLAPSKFSDFALDSAKKRAVFGCESGVLTVIDAMSGKKIVTIDKLHVDNNFGVDFAKDLIASAGQDKRACYYRMGTKEKGCFNGSFLVYAVGISPDERYVAYAMDEDNSITIYDMKSMQKAYILRGQKSTLDAIVFESPERLFSASADNSVMVWKLKK